MLQTQGSNQEDVACRRYTRLHKIDHHQDSGQGDSRRVINEPDENYRDNEGPIMIRTFREPETSRNAALLIAVWYN